MLCLSIDCAAGNPKDNTVNLMPRQVLYPDNKVDFCPFVGAHRTDTLLESPNA